MLYDRHPELQSKWDKAFWASSKNALLRANTKPPVELVVADLPVGYDELSFGVTAKSGSSITKKLEILMSGGTIVQYVVL